MSNLAKQTQQSLSGHDQTVQTNASEGEWMYLTDASQVTGVSERTLRRHIKRNLLKSKRLGKLANSPLQVWITPEHKNALKEEINPEFAEVEDFFEEVGKSDSMTDEVEIAEPSEVEDNNSTNKKSRPVEVDQLIRAITETFGNKLDEQKEVIFQLRQDLHEKETQLRLLPDLQKKLEEEEKLKSFETAALQKQIEELNKENSELKAAAEQLQKAANEKKSLWSWFTGK
jgi:chromosome segregation ATPase